MTGCANIECGKWLGFYHIDSCQYVTDIDSAMAYADSLSGIVQEQVSTKIPANEVVRLRSLCQEMPIDHIAMLEEQLARTRENNLNLFYIGMIAGMAPGSILGIIIFHFVSK